MSTTPEKTVVEFAVGYTEAHLSPVPIGCNGDELPAFGVLPRGEDGKAEWGSLQKAIATPEQIHQMFGGRQEVGVGIVGGAVSGNLSILDVDNLELWEPYRKLVDEQAPGLLDRLPTVGSPRPGRHVYYRTSEPARGSTKLAQRPYVDEETGKKKRKTLIEIKAEGGYCVCPGGPLKVHDTGRPYRHVSGPPITEPPVISAEEQEILWDAARSFNEYFPEPEQPKGETRREKAERSGETLGLMPGDDFNERSTWEDIVVPHGWTKEPTHE